MTRRGVFLALFAFLWGCVSGPIQLERAIDSPEHHVLNGFKFIDKGRAEDAIREFQLALDQDGGSPAAFRGMGLACGMKNDFKAGFEFMGKALKHAKGDSELSSIHVSYMRLHMMRRADGWLDEVEDAFRSAVGLRKDHPEAHYYLGMAYKYGSHFEKAVVAFEKARRFDISLAQDVTAQLRLLRKIQRAAPRSSFGKRMVVRDFVTRAETAELLIRELGLSPAHYQAGFGKGNLELPRDTANHPLRSSVEAVLGMDIKGLEIFPDGNFYPDAALTRAACALIAADLLSSDEKARFTVSHRRGRSPYRDVSDGSFYFDAVMICTEQAGIMESEDGLFRPMGKVSGADAILVIRRLEEILEQDE